MSSIDRGTVLQQLDRLFSEGTLSGLGDGQLLERYLTRRDPAAFEALVEVHGPMVLGLCRRFLRDPRDIEDAFQATFLVLVRKAPGIRDGSLLSNWLYGVALRVATRARANLLRRRGREQAIGDAEFAARPESHEVLGWGPVLDQELSRLPAKYRAPLVLCYLRGQTHDQAANELRCPVGTVRSRMARGRDLLKRRLTRRGCAPSAALFGAGLDVPAHLLTEVVPARLVAATLEAALAIGSSHTIQAGAAAASVLALTQGVVMSMKFAQVKWIGLALLATGLSAGGAVVVAAVSAQDPAATGEPAASSVASPYPLLEPSKKAVATSTSESTSSQTTEERLRWCESQVDLMCRLSGIDGPVTSSGFTASSPTLDRLEKKLRFLGMYQQTQRNAATGLPAGQRTTKAAAVTAHAIPASTATSTTTIGKATPSSLATARTIEPRAIPEGSSSRIRELEAELKLATPHYQRVQQLHQRGVVSEEELQTASGKVEMTRASLQGMDDDLADQLEQAQLIVKKKKAELDEANAQTDAARTTVGRNARLNHRNLDMVAEEDVARAEANLRSAEAHIRVKAVELEEAELQCRKLERWRARIEKILEVRRLQ